MKVNFILFISISAINKLQSLYIRIIDDFYLQNDKINYNIYANNYKTVNTINSSTNLYYKSLTESNVKSVLVNKASKYNILEDIINEVILSKYIIRSLYLTMFEKIDYCLEFIKGKTDPQLKYSRKEALLKFIKLIEKISKNEIIPEYQVDNLDSLIPKIEIKDIELMEEYKEDSHQFINLETKSEFLGFIYDLVISLFENIIIREKSEGTKKYTEIFESHKISLNFFFNCLCENDTDVCNVKVYEKLKGNLMFIVKSTIYDYQNPFFYNLILALFCRRYENVKFIMDILSFIVNLLIAQKFNDSNDKVFIFLVSNIKNLIVLIYRITLAEVAESEYFKSVKEQFVQLSLNFFNYVFKSPIIFTKLIFDTYFDTKSNLKNFHRSSKIKF